VTLFSVEKQYAGRFLWCEENDVFKESKAEQKTKALPARKIAGFKDKDEKDKKFLFRLYLL